MALTEELGGVSNQVRPLDPGPRGPSFLETAANIGSRAIETWDNVSQRRAQNRRDQLQAAERETATGLSQAFLVDQYAQSNTASENVPEGLRIRVNTLRKMRSGVQQGRLDSGRLQTAVEMEIARVQAEAPEMLPTALTYLRQEGFDHLLLRDAQNVEANLRADEEANRAARTRSLQTGHQFLGTLATDMSNDEVARYGAQIISLQAQREELEAQLSHQDTLTERDRTELGRQFYSHTAQDFYTRIAPSINSVTDRLRSGEITGEQARQEWGSMQRALDGFKQQTLADAAALGVDREVLSNIESLFDTQTTVLSAAFEDDTARSAINRMASETTGELLQASPAARLIMGLDPSGSLFGLFAERTIVANALEAGLGGELARFMTGNLIEDHGAVRDAQTYTQRPGTVEAEEARDRLTRLLGPNTNINDLTDEDIEDGYGATMLNQLTLSAAGALMENGIVNLETSLHRSGGADRRRAQRTQEVGIREAGRSAGQGRFDRFAYYYGTTLDYAANRELVRDQIDGQGLSNTARTLFNPAMLEALRASGDDNLAQKSVNTATTLLDRVQSNYVSGAGIRQAIFGDRMEFDPARGQFTVTSLSNLSRDPAPDAYVREVAGLAVGRSGRDRSPATNPDMVRAAEAANQALQFLVGAAEVDPRFRDTQLSELEWRQFFVNGELPEGKEISGSKSSPSFAERLAFEQNARASEPVDMNAYLDRLAMVESSGRTNAQASTSSAAGLFQFTEDTWRDSARLVPELRIRMDDPDFMDLRFDPELSRRVVEATTASNAELLRDVLDREPTAGELYAAHFLGRRGSIRLLNAEPDQPADEVFPRPARANRNVFYKRDGTPRTVAELRSWLEQRMRA